ncbi:MAG: restriction endonuclease subunit S [Anaerolineales bacterium]
MTTVATIFPRAFAVCFSEIERWDPASFHRILWHWPSAVMRPLGSVLRMRKEKVDRSNVNFADLQPITIHFDGSIDRRQVDAGREYSMDLFYARPGDIVVAKIDLKNGAVGLVPNDWHNVVVTGHFAVYEPDRSSLVAEYLCLLVQTSFFKAHLWRNKVGAEGRKEVKLDFFKAQRIPLPPLPVQRKIVAAWEAARKDAASAAEKIAELEREIEAQFLADLGITPPLQCIGPKCLSVWWRNLERWDLAFARRPPFNPNSKTYPNARLKDAVQPIRHTTRRVLPSMTPNEDFNYIGMENVESITGRLVDFSSRKGSAIKSSCVAFDRNHILYGKLRPYLRKVVDCSELPMTEGIASSEFLPLRPSKNVTQSWLAFYLRSVAIAEQAKAAIGARMPRIAPDALLNFIIPIPPLSVQHEIMKRISARRAEIAKMKREAKAALEAAKADVEAMILGTKPV